MKKFYKSDFDFILRLKDSEGQQVPFPECDWEIRFYTDSKTYWYTASCRGGVYVNCRREGDAIRFIFNDHRLGPGILRWEPHIELPDGAYPDGIQDLLDRQRLGIELVDGPGDCRPPAGVDIEVMLPAIYSSAYDLAVRNGYKGTLDEYTEYVNRFPEVVETADRRIPEMSEQITAMDTEFRREIVGLWDATAEMQAKLADLYSTETRNLLKRLGYEEDDIEEYIWAVSHLDLNITIEDLRVSVNTFEMWRDTGVVPSGSCSVMPKWTEEMEAGESTPKEFLAKLARSYPKYLPHLDTAKEPWFGPRFPLLYTAGIHARTDMEVVICSASLKGIGSVTGRVRSFCTQDVYNSSTLLRFIRKFKSDIPVNLANAFFNTYYLKDFSGVDVSNATDLRFFAYLFHTTSSSDTLVKTIPAIPKGMTKEGMFSDRSFKDIRIDIEDDFGYLSSGPISKNKNIFNDRSDSPGGNGSWFENCDLYISSESLRTVGVLKVYPDSVSRVNITDSHVGFNPFNLISYDPFSSGKDLYGVWEVDCPGLSTIDIFNKASTGPRVSVNLFNIGAYVSNYRGLGLKYLMPHTRFNVDSFKRSLASWKPAPENGGPYYVYLYSTQAAVLSEQELATFTEKGYTVIIDDTGL